MKAPGRADVAAVAGLFALTLVAHGAAVRQWWMWDDTQLLFAVVHWPFHELLFSPPAWQAQAGSNFVPALLAGFKVDLLLFGLEPRGFYIHHLLTFAAAIALLYVYVTRFTTRATAWLAAGACATAASAFTVAHLLMNRHYAEGLLLSVAAALLFLRSEERPWRGALGALLYFAAALEKEVFAPLPLLVMLQDLLAGHRFRTLARNVAFNSVAAVVYLVWRIGMLGAAGGFSLQRSAGEAIRFAGDVWSHVIGSGSLWMTAAAAIFLAIAIASAFAKQTWRAGAAAIAVMVFVALPLLGLRLLDHRHVYVATVAIVVVAAIAVGRAKAATVPFVAFAAFCLALASGGVRHAGDVRGSWLAMQNDGRHLWSAPSGAPPLLSVPNGWYVEGVRWLRENVKGEKAPRAIASIPGLVLSGHAPAGVTSLHRDRAAVDALYGRLRAGFAPGRPLAMKLVRKGRQLSWTFGPDAPGVRWYYLAMPAMDLVQLAPRGSLPLPSHLRAPSYDFVPDGFRFRILRVAGEEWTATPELPFPRSDGEVVWVQPR